LAPIYPNIRIYIRGGGDLASGVAYRLVKAGFPIVMAELPAPIFVRRTVSYGNAIYEGGRYNVENIEAVLAPDEDKIFEAWQQSAIPIIIDPDGHWINALSPMVLIDARMQKRKQDTHLHMAPLVIAMGPGFIAGEDCHAVIETNRGHSLGRVIWQGSALPDTGTPGQVAGYRAERVLRAPITGHVIPAEGVKIGVWLKVGQTIATISDGHQSATISAPFDGMLRGLIHSSVKIQTGVKIGDLDPRHEVQNCFTISDKALAIGGGALEAVLSAEAVQTAIMNERVRYAAP